MGPRIYPSYQDTNITAKGSLIINYNELVNGPGGDNFEIYVNDVLRDKIWLDVEGYYSTHLVLNDVVKLKFPGEQQSLSLDISRKNYTTDDNNDNGLTYTYIGSTNQFGVTDYEYSFTATTTNDSYNFEYIVNCDTLQITPTPLPPSFCKGFNGDVMDIAIQPDGKIIVTGTFGSFTDRNGTTTVCPYITRLTSGGTIDTSFTPSASVQAYVADGKYSLCLLNNGYFIIYRTFNQFNFRVSPDGLLHEYLGLGDTSVTAPFSYKARIPSINGTGKWYIGGQGFTVGGVISPIYRYNSDGSRDTSFNPPSETRQATAIYELSNGKVIVAVGLNYTYQLNSDGSFDLDYDVYNPLYGYIDNIAEGQSVDKVYFTLYGGLIIRMNTTDGSMDYGFLYGNRGYVSFVQTLGAGVDDDKIIYNSNVGLTLRRLDLSGTTDNSFIYNLGSSSGTTVGVRRVSSTSDSMYIFGSFDQWNGYSVGRLFKLNADGSEDFSFYNFLCEPTHTPTPTPTPTATPTVTPTPTATPTATPTPTPTGTPTPTPTVTPTPTPTSTPVPIPIITSGLTIYMDGSIYSYPGTGTTWYDIPDYTYNGTLYNSPTFTGATGGYFDFVSASSQYAIIGDNTTILGGFTWGAWINVPTSASGQELIFRGNMTYPSLGIGRTSGSKFTVSVSSGFGSKATVTSTTSIVGNTWYYVVGTRTGNDIKLYVNGVSEGGTGFIVGMYNSTGWYMAADGTAPYNSVKVGGFEYYNRQLSAAEVLSNFNARKAIYGY